MVEQVLFETNRVNPQARKLTLEVMLWVVLAMGILTDLPIRQVFKRARRLRMGEDAPGRSSLRVAKLYPVAKLDAMIALGPYGMFLEFRYVIKDEDQGTLLFCWPRYRRQHR